MPMFTETLSRDTNGYWLGHGGNFWLIRQTEIFLRDKQSWFDLDRYRSRTLTDFLLKLPLRLNAHVPVSQTGGFRYSSNILVHV